MKKILLLSGIAVLLLTGLLLTSANDFGILTISHFDLYEEKKTLAEQEKAADAKIDSIKFFTEKVQYYTGLAKQCEENNKRHGHDKDACAFEWENVNEWKAILQEEQNKPIKEFIQKPVNENENENQQLEFVNNLMIKAKAREK